MNIRIIRGTKQIGGSAVEITTKKTRVFFDFGAELNDSPRELIVNGVTKGKTKCDAVFFSHNHGDHAGLLDTINNDIPLYMGKDAKNISSMFAKRTYKSKYYVEKIKQMKTYKANTSIKIKDIIITPYYVDHSAFDAYMFLIEADGKKVLYTGDFRKHGYIGKGLDKVLKTYIKKVDAVICEGTTLSNAKEHLSITENEVATKISEVVKKNKYVFVMCASTNIYRIAGICNIVPRGKHCLMDKFQYDMVQYIKKEYEKDSKLYKFNKANYYNWNFEDKYRKNGFVMFIRQNNDFKKWLDKFPTGKIVYSEWQGYLDMKSGKNRPTIKEWFGDMNYVMIHTSGHADESAIKTLIAETNPDKVIPIHTENKKRFRELFGEKRYIDAKDGKTIKI